MKEEKKDNQKSFEEAMAELKAIVEALEDQELPLEKAVSMFEEGIRLSRYCQELLDQAEKKVKILSKDEETGQILQKETENL